MKRFLSAAVFSMFLVSCDQSSKIDETDAPPKSADSAKVLNESVDYEFRISHLYVDDVPSDTGLVTIVENKSVVFTQPDTTAIEELIEENGEQEFYTLSDDNMFYQNKAGEFLKGKGYAVVFANKRYITFRGKDKVFTIDTQKAKNKGWLTILFDPEKEPKLVNPLEIEEESKRNQ